MSARPGAWPARIARSLLAALPLIASVASGQEPAAPPLIVEDIQCRGNTATSCNFILGQVYAAPGDRLDEEELANARLRLVSLPNFKSVDIYLEKGSAKGKAIVVVEVVEADPIFSETVASLSYQLDSLSQLFAGRVSHQNLQGEGKILDLTARGRIPLDGPVQQSAALNLRYADPHLFGSKKYFLTAGVGYGKLREENRVDEFFDVEEAAIGFTVGRRFADFSYVIAGYNYLPKSHIVARSFNDDDGTYELEDGDFDQQASIGYGWNSEDDYYFPTRGSAFTAGLSARFAEDGETFGSVRLQFRKTWQTESGALWTFKFGGEPRTEFRVALDDSPLLTLSYARWLEPGGRLGLRRGRWYVEPGFDDYQEGGPILFAVAIKAGVRLELDSFGIVDLYFIGSFD